MLNDCYKLAFLGVFRSDFYVIKLQVTECQNFKSCVKFYREVFRDINKELSDKIFKEIYSKVMMDSAQGMMGVAPEITIYQFLDILEEEISDKKGEIKDDKEE